jgi:DNA-binding NarL/FixJ family response regulator
VTRSKPQPAIVCVIVGELDPLIVRGLMSAVEEDGRVRVMAHGVSASVLEGMPASESRERAVALVSDNVDYALLTTLASSNPPTNVIVLTKTPTRLLQTSLSRIGAICLAHSIAETTLLSAIRVAASRERAVLASDGARIFDLSGLTPRELGVYDHLARGRQYDEIALKLHIGYETVRTHTSRICRKLGVQNRLELVGVDRHSPDSPRSS